MLKIYPKVTTYNYTCKNNVEREKTNGIIEQNMQSTPIKNSSIAFKGYGAEAHLRYGIKKLVSLVKSDDVKKIAFITHAHPDCDAIGSMVAGKNIIQEATGKIADMFTMNSLRENAAFMDQGREMKVISDIFKDTTKIPDQIKAKFGDYDLVIVTDTPFKKLLDKDLDEGIVENAKKIVKIDHHPMRPEDNIEDYKYGNINIVDSSKDSASQIVMQLVKPFGLDSTNINPKISDAIASGLLTDSGQFQYARNAMSYKDAAELQKTSNLGKISKESNSMNLSEFELLAKFMSNIKFSPDKEIAYYVVGKDLTGTNVKNANITALNLISKVKGIKYYFSIIESAAEDGKISSSLRSNDKAINKIASEFGGGGHDKACGFSTKVDNIDSFIATLINKLTDLKNS